MTASWGLKRAGNRATAIGTLLAIVFLGTNGAATASAPQEESAQEPPVTEVAPEQPIAVTEDHRARLATLFEGHLLDTENGQDFVETQGYRRLLETLYHHSPQEIHADIEGELSFEEALENPDAWRGRFVRVRGLLAGYEAVRQREPIGRNVDVYRGVVTEADFSEGVVFDLLEPPPERIESRTVVDLEGLFYRTVRYETKDGTTVEAPYVLGRTLRAVDLGTVERSHVLDRTMLVLVVLAVAYIVGRVVFSMSRKQTRPPGSRSSGLQEALRKRQHLHSDRPR